MENLQYIRNLDLSHVERASIYNILENSYKYIEGIDADPIYVDRLDMTWYAKLVSGRGLHEIKTSSVVLSVSQEKALFSRYNGLKESIEFGKTEFVSEASSDASRQLLAERMLEIQSEIDEIKSILVEYNIALVVNVAIKYNNSILDFDTLISEANTKLLECLESFDVSQGYKFSTYVTTSLTRHYKKLIERKASENVISIGEDYDVEAVEENSEVAFMKEIIASNLAGLDDKELEVLRLRYLDGCLRNVEEVGSLMGISKGRISQIEKSARQKLLEAMT
jgi:RNA polymerase sigma factor (sigma-70 family)